MPKEKKTKQKSKTNSTSNKAGKAAGKNTFEKNAVKVKDSAVAKETETKQEKQVDTTKTNDNDRIESLHIKKNKKSQALIIILIIGIIVIIAVALGLLIPFFVDRLNISSNKIIERFAEKHSYVVDIENYTEETDPNNIMGHENAYTSKSSWNDNRFESVPEEFAGTMEIFRNNKDAEFREWKLNYTKENCGNYIKAEKYGEELAKYICNGLSYGTIYRKGVAVFRLTRALSDEQVEEYLHGFDDLVSGFMVNESDVPTDEKIDELKKDAEEKAKSNFEDQIKSFEDDLNKMADDFEKQIKAATESLSDDDYAGLTEGLNYMKSIPFFSNKIEKWTASVKNVRNKITDKKNAVVTFINNRLSAVASSLSESDLSKVKDEIKSITDPYYDSYKDGWETKISDIEGRIEAKKLVARNRTFGAGKYKVGTDIDSGYYDIVAISGSGNLFIRNNSDRLDVNEVMASDGSYGFSKRYNNEFLGYGYTVEIRSNLVLKFEAKK